MNPGTIVTYSLLFVSLYFEIFLLVAFLERRFVRSGGRSAASLARFPSVAIVVPCFNEEKTVASTLQSLLALEYPKDKLEIIVVDDGSTDRTFDIASRFADARQALARFAGTPQATAEDEPIFSAEKIGNAGEARECLPRVRVFHKKNGGKHTAMNCALAQTNADLIGCLDADSIVAPEALRCVVQVFENPQVAAVTPGIHAKETRNALQHMQKVEYRLSLFVRFILASLGSAYITPGPFSTFRASAVRNLGGWRYGHSTEDMELALRLQQAGFLIGNAPKAIVHTSTPKTVKHLFRQRVRWTYGFLRNAVDYRAMIGNRSYGNLGLLILPCALISIFAGIYFFARIVYLLALALWKEIGRIALTGILPHLGFNIFYINTSAMWFLIFAAVVLVLVLICAGSFIGTGRRRPPIGTPVFVLFYSFLAPLWLGAALVRAVFKTGVKWR